MAAYIMSRHIVDKTRSGWSGFFTKKRPEQGLGGDMVNAV